MSLSWGQIRNLYREAVGDAQVARQEEWLHLTEGYRTVASQLDIPELTQPEDYVTLAQGDDWFAMDADVAAIRSMVNLTAGHEMYQEPGGWQGRSRYIEATTGTRGKPPEGTPTHWVRSGDRIYVRDTASAATNLQIHYKVQVPVLDVSLIDNHALTPQQYDKAIVHAAAASCLSVHPKLNRAEEGQPSPLQVHLAELNRIMTQEAATSATPRGLEAKGSRTTTRLAGYRIKGWR